MFEPVDSSVSFPHLEEEIGRFWKDNKIYEKSLAARAARPAFVFYEGPPTANGLPHPGHCLTRAIKDLFPRYRTMRGYRCVRKAGWDTHGLPVEVEVCKELGIHSKEEIESFGVEPFVWKCLQSVFRYTREWEQITERLGFWINLDEAYVTYHQSYVESVWWALKNLFDRGLLYQGHKIVWWWAQGGTALSSGEVGEGYREVADPSVYVRFPLVVEPGDADSDLLQRTDLLVWTTTPWTLPSNQFAAVNPDLDYVVASAEGHERKLIVAAALVEAIAAKLGKPLRVESVVRGQSLVGRRYLPPFDYYWKDQGQKRGRLKAGGCQHIAWRVVPADFVTIDTGTGVVHQAPAFGEVDYDLLLAEQERFVEGEGPPLICAVAPDGRFTAEAPDYKGRWVKDADRDIIRRMKAEGTLLLEESYVHDYPFCWRAEEDPLIQYPRKSWFIRTTRLKDKMLQNNRRIRWLPEHIRDGRFGNFLETNVDWALSRERYWGTPLPIWVCEETGYAEAVASYDELLAKPGVEGAEVWLRTRQAHPELPEHLKVHKPYIDAITYDSPRAPGKRMRRVPEVIDCWFDSGSMPFAQWGYPHVAGSEKLLADQFPADFISEALDQTRGWFYSLLAISTLLFSQEEGNPAGDSRQFLTQRAPAIEYPHPYRNCVVLGFILGEDGAKMSKRKRNYREPQEIFDRYGADALRWYFFANQPPWTSIRYSEAAIHQSIPEFLLRLWNVYGFFVIYANIDGFDPAAAIPGNPGQLGPEVLTTAQGFRAPAQRSELDRWVLSELHRATAAVVEAMDAYDNFTACGRITQFVDALSNWYIRRSRDRFWRGGWSPDKADAYWTLYECLLTTAKLIAPFVPFVAEAIWQNLAVKAFAGKGTGDWGPARGKKGLGIADSGLEDAGPSPHRLPSPAPVQSVHLCDYPVADPGAIDEQLSSEMALVREVVSLGRSARMAARLKVRQPLSRVEVILADPSHRQWLADHASLIREELNVKRVEFAQKADQYITYTVLPDLKRLGPRLGKRLPALRQVLAQTDGAQVRAALEAEGKVTFTLADGPVVLDAEEVQIRLKAKQGWTAAQGRSCVVVVATELTPELLSEGLAREVVHAIQNCRKQMDCRYTDRIRVAAITASPDLHAAICAHQHYIEQETLAADLNCTLLPENTPNQPEIVDALATLNLATGAARFELAIAGHELTLHIKVAANAG
jgi:isoleucyl-tRNA synthetase